MGDTAAVRAAAALALAARAPRHGRGPARGVQLIDSEAGPRVRRDGSFHGFGSLLLEGGARAVEGVFRRGRPCGPATLADKTPGAVHANVAELRVSGPAPPPAAPRRAEPRPPPAAALRGSRA